MSNDEHPVNKIERALIRAHRNRPQIEPNAAWTGRIMAEVLRQRLADKQNGLAELAQRLVWRYAAVSCAFAVLLLVFAMKTEPGPDQLIWNLFIGDPVVMQTLSLFVPLPG